jgi:hypothetical protein
MMSMAEAEGFPDQSNHAPPITPASFRCVQCGYDLSGTAVGGRCPECGMVVAESLRSETAKLQTSPKAKSCMVMGILALVIFGPIFGPLAIIYYFSAQREMLRGRYSDASRTMARAGLMTGIIATVISFFWILMILADM